jgi:hypothetical protein
MEHEITIVDRGRGPQLSTSRITVQDLLPYFQLGYPHEQIIREAMPSLSVAEIEIAKNRPPRASQSTGALSGHS